MEDTLKDYKSYIELREILKYTDSNVANNIPKKVFEMLNSINGNGYKFEYDFTKSLNEQKISKQTKELLAGLYIKYCCDEKTSKELIEKCKLNDEIAHKQYEIQWNKKNSKQKKLENISENNNTTDLVVQKQGIFTKIINKIKSIFKR